MKKIISSTLAFIFVLGILVYLNQKSNRTPSSIDQVNPDGSINTRQYLTDGNLKKQIKKVLLRSWDWHSDKHSFNLRLENVQIHSVPFCNLYPSLSLVLEAPNTSYSGEHPEVAIDQTCDNKNGFANYHIKLDFLKDRQTLRKYQTAATVSSTIRVKSYEDELPNNWRVKQIIFHPASHAPDESLVMTGYEILSVLGYTVEFRIDTENL
ncbi:MAG: hypothetical protein JNL11_09850 [Bdellovibrionaceae bacterium]|nr:hypothetical protein [Pseudobdellovibrionaceae bacterium]